MKWHKHLKAQTQWWLDKNITGNTAKRQMEGAYYGYRQGFEKQRESQKQSNVNAYAQAKQRYEHSLVGKTDKATTPARYRANLVKDRIRNSISVRTYKKTGRSTLSDQQQKNRKRKSGIYVNGKKVTGKDIVNKIFRRG